MSEKEQTALQRWGSREPTGWGKVRFWLGVAVVLALVVAIPIYFSSRGTDDRAQRQRLLEQRYVEDVELAVSSSTGTEVVQIDGEPREDCKSIDDGYLECTDDPQPTLVTREDAPTP